VKTFELLGVDADEATLRRMVRRYEELLPDYLPLKQGRVLPNVREILEALRDRTDVRSFLLTGNTRGGARAKLTHYDLFKYFTGPVSRGPADAQGAFAEDTGARATIAARALELARGVAPIADEKVFVIGDTPHDVECANAIGARTIAVATGGYTRHELAPHGAWRIVDELPPVDEFIELIEVGAATAGAGPAETGIHAERGGEARRG
jgi:phosphoglycolate phosphatase-like HAD superfamily hydrolase